jgi:hypothetical protein
MENEVVGPENEEFDMRIMSGLTLFVCLCLIVSISQSGDVSDVKKIAPEDLEAHLLGLTGLNWINPETDVVLIGEVGNVEEIALKFFDNQTYNMHGLFTINSCRWINGTESEQLEIVDASFAYKDTNGEWMKQYTAGGPWLVAGEKFIVIASPISINIEGEESFRDFYFLKYLDYLNSDCFDDEQELSRFKSFSSDFTKAKSNDLMELGRDCITINKTMTGKTLGQCIEEIRDSIQRKVKND